MSRHTLLLLLGLLPSLLPAAGAQRPNVLWILAEDLGPELSCYGTEQARTPNLDRLAAEGVRYTRAFTTAPVCSSSRSAFMTGMHASSIGAHNHRSHRRDGFTLPEGVRLLTHRLRAAGYFTANVRGGIEGARGTGKTDWNFAVSKPFDSDRWQDLAGHQPFYAQINLPETHRGGAWRRAQHTVVHRADPARVKIPPYYPDHALTRRDWAEYLNAVMALDRKVGLVLARLREDGLEESTVVVFFADHGRAMVRGKQWPYDSGLHVPLIIRWPKGLPPPPGLQKGSVDGRLISAIDLTATTLTIAGIARPKGMQGRVFLGEDRDPDREYCFGGRDRCDETVFRIRTVRTERYRYIRNFMPERPFLQRNRYKERQYPVIALMRELHEKGELNAVQEVLMAPHRPAEELYDLEKDPFEIHDLAGSPAHREVLARLRKVLADWIEASGDQGRIAEPQAILDFWEERMRRNDARARRREHGK